ncbi:MAG: HD domain-containing protein [Cyanobacteriota/Melainabacteria group bacterium]
MVVDRFSQTGWLNAGLEAHRDPRSRSVYALLEKYSIRVDHAEHVAYLARQLFEQTRGILHDYPEEVAHILWSASMLHDLGTYISRNGHHKHSYYLIRHGGLLGHSEEEVGMIASVARYHRGSDPKESHEAWLEVQEGSRPIVRGSGRVFASG